MSKDFKRTGKPFVRVNKSLEQFAWPFERMHKTDNVERTGKPFKRVKIILLIRMIGCAIGLPIERMLKWFSKPFRAHGLIMKQAMLLCIVFVVVLFLSLLSISRPLFSRSKMETISISYLNNVFSCCLKLLNISWRCLSSWLKMTAEFIVCLTTESHRCGSRRFDRYTE